MIYNINKKILYFSFIATLLFVGGCKDRDEDVNPDNGSVAALNNSIYSIMKEWYLWNKDLPTVNTAQYETPEALLDALRFKEMDRWSYIQDEETFDQYFTSGIFYGYGFGMKLDEADNLRVSFVYRDSPMDREAVSRGYKILKVNNQLVSDLIASNSLAVAFGDNKEGVSTSMEVEDLLGNTRTISVQKEEVTINSVLHTEVKEIEGRRIGYLVFNNFIETSIADLDAVFSTFKQQNITDLVLDLRYNGGGSLQVAQHLASLIASSKAGTTKFVELTYNAEKVSSNEPYDFQAVTNGLNIDKLVVITAGGTASASEVIINGLRPFMEVITVGDDTHGKPVGMNVWKVDGYALVPITFKVANSLGQAEYFNGLPADAYRNDNLSVGFGDHTEDSLEEALYYIVNNGFSSELVRKASTSMSKDIVLEGFKAEVGAF